jgi:cold shock CspA family protein
MTAKFKGIVKYYNAQHCYGFIKPDELVGADLFVHRSDLVPPLAFLLPGEIVRFHIVPGKTGSKHKRAVEVE